MLLISIQLSLLILGLVDVTKGQSCDTTLTSTATVAQKTAQNGTFSSSTCTWTITAPTDRKVFLLLANITLDAIPTCDPGSGIAIYNGDTSGSVLGVVCDSYNVSYESSGNLLTIQFPASLITATTGFTAEYRDYPLETCAELNEGVIAYIGQDFNILSPGYPAGITGSAYYCLWIIQPVGKQRVGVTIETAGLPSSTCQHANITLHNGNSLDNWCPGQDKYFQSWESNLILEVKLSPQRSLLIKYRGIEESQCNGTLTATTNVGTLSSPGYPTAFPSFTECRWIINSEMRKGSIQIRITKSDIEETDGCATDVIKVISANRYPRVTSGSLVIASTCNNQVPMLIYGYEKYAIVVFQSFRPNNTRAGFQMTYNYGPHEPCGGTFEANDTAQKIQSPGYPYRYPMSAECTWTITARNPENAVQIKFLVNELSFFVRCYYLDTYIDVFDGDSTMKYKLITVCSNSTPTVQGTERSMTIKFHTGRYSSRKGFELEYTEIPASAVSKLHRSLLASRRESGFNSPRYPDGQVQNVDASWTIMPDWGRYRVVLTISVDLGNKDNCNNNYVKVYDGNQASNAALMSTLCGKMSGTFLSRSENLTLVLKTDSTLAKRGFSVTYHQDVLDGCMGETENLTAYFTSKSNLQSPNYPKSYPNMMSCTYLIETSLTGYYIHMEINETDIAGKDCKTDYLEIFDGPTAASPLLLKLCGTEPKAVNSKGSSVFVRFISDNAVTAKGFNMIYSSVRVDDSARIGLIVGLTIGLIVITVVIITAVVYFMGNRKCIKL